MEKYLLSKEQKAQIRSIREETKKITKSKQTAIKYLKDSGISDFVKKAMKDSNSSGTSSKNTPG